MPPATKLANYQLSYTFTSVCEPQDNTTNWIEASAGGYETASSFTLEGGLFSDPPIYCTSEPQVINLSLHPLSAMDSRGHSLRRPNGPRISCGDLSACAQSSVP